MAGKKQAIEAQKEKKKTSGNGEQVARGLRWSFGFGANFYSFKTAR